MKFKNDWNYVLMNPPYGGNSGNTLHLKFVDKCLDIAEKVVVIMPFTFITKTEHKSNNKYKEKWNSSFVEVEEVDSKVFKDTGMANVGIYEFNNNKKNEKIKINKLKGGIQELDSLLDYSNLTDYEKNIINFLNKNNPQKIIVGAGQNLTERYKKQFNITDEKYKEYLKEALKTLEPIKEHFNKYPNGAVLICNNSNGGMNGTYMSSKVGQIFTSYNDTLEFFKSVKPWYNVLLFKTLAGCKNCKEAMKRPLLRFALYRTQDDQHMNPKKCYRNISAIDWSDDKVKTDEGLLELCGCPKDKCKEYADYCKKIIDNVDK